jgi:nitrite reductase (NADH) large subunit
MAAKNKKTVCICNGVTKSEIVRILKKGAINLEEVRQFTLASSGCGRCKPEVEAIVDDYLKGKTSPLQRRLEF